MVDAVAKDDDDSSSKTFTRMKITHLKKESVM
jgi:hypothetical protein